MSVNQIIIIIEDLLISSRLNDHMNCYRRFNADFMIPYISAMDHARKFSSYVHLPFINRMFLYRYAQVILCNIGEVIIFEHGRYILAWEHIRMFIFSSYVLLACSL